MPTLAHLSYFSRREVDALLLDVRPLFLTVSPAPLTSLRANSKRFGMRLVFCFGNVLIPRASCMSSPGKARRRPAIPAWKRVKGLIALRIPPNPDEPRNDESGFAKPPILEGAAFARSRLLSRHRV